MSQETGNNETFNRRINIIIAIVVAIIAVLGSFITKLENEASTASNKASVAEQQYYYQAIGTQISGKANVNHAFGTVYQLWYQYEVQLMSARNRGEEDAVKTYAELKDAVTKTSSLFDPKYFNPETGKVNLVLYEADEYHRELYELEERQLAAGEVASVWDDKSSIYILQLTLLAVAGFLLGLALMTKARVPTLVFAASGILLVIIISGWAYQVSKTHMYERPIESITAYAEGASLIDQKLWDEALTKLNEAIEKAGADNPYGRAHLLRARVHSAMGNFNDAISDYQIAIASGYAGDSTVDANLVQAFFYVGDFTSAIETGTAAIKNSPDNLVLRQQVTMAFLASGDTQTASEQVAILLEKAKEKVKRERELGDNNAAAEVWWLLNEAAHQYDQLAELLTNANAKSPVKVSIADQEVVSKEAEQLASQLRAGAIALKYDIQEENISTSSAQIDIKTINLIWTLDKKYVYKVDLEFKYNGIKEGQLLSIMTYRNGIEEPSWSFSQKWTGRETAGTVRSTINPSYSSLYIVPPGYYTVSIYLNDRLMAQNAFTIEDPNNQLASSSDDIFAFNSMLDQFDYYTSDFIYGDFEDYDWLYDDWYYYYYDPYFFYGSETDYTYFLEGAYNPYFGYCTDEYDLSCYTASDYDGDGVPDEYDFCVSEPGALDFNGCSLSDSDADGDGIINDIDACPYIAGGEESNGCPIETLDFDGDEVPDNYDTCLYDPGPIENGGCPLAFDDADGDGITNDLDVCPYQPGLEENGGCPPEGFESDFDGDGVADDHDLCIYEPGSPDNYGCPGEGSGFDSDGDGIDNDFDVCPDEPGSPENYGCPDTGSGVDSDGDGTPDMDDPCPDDPSDSCIDGDPGATDSDGDGVPDVDDPCPDDPYDSCIDGDPGTTDSDGDGVPDVDDPCPDDPYDSCIDGDPGITDSDGDGVPDVDDPCPDDPYDSCISSGSDLTKDQQRPYSFFFEPTFDLDSFVSRVSALFHFNL